MNATIQTLARIAIGSFFIVSGITHITAFEQASVLSSWAGLSIPDLLVKVSLAVELGGGILLLLGYRIRPVILSLAILLVFTTTGFRETDGGPWFAIQPVEALKTLSVVAGLGLLLANGAGKRFPWSFVPDLEYRKATVK